jgi:transcriptional regulator with XRE-family HTH domain
MERPTTAPAARAASPVGRLLRGWRAARGLSQFDLAMRAGFSTRHVSFIETGRSQPSRQALLVLAESLEVPLRQRNELLEAGGFADAYRETPLDAEAMAPIRGMLRFILDRHAPYAAIVLDRYSTCVMGNAAADRLVALTVDPSIVTPQANHLRLAFHPLGARRHIVNWDEVSRHLLARAERELAAPGDPQAAALLAELRGYAGPQPRTPPHAGRRPAAADPYPARRRRAAPVQRHHDARNAARRHAAGAADRDVLPGRRRLRGGVAGAGRGAWPRARYFFRSGGPSTGVVSRTRIR